MMIPSSLGRDAWTVLLLSPELDNRRFGFGDRGYLRGGDTTVAVDAFDVAREASLDAEEPMSQGIWSI